MVNSILEARKLVDAVTVFHNDGKGRPCSFNVEEDGKHYLVILKRGQGVFGCSCDLVTDIGPKRCPHRRQDVACKHIIAAIMLSARESGVKLAWCSWPHIARRVNRIHNGSIYRIGSKRSKLRKKWVVVYK